MIGNTQGIVLRNIKYGDTSLIVQIFTRNYGLHSYLIKGIRSTKSKLNRAGLFQIGTILNLIVEHKPHKNLQTLKEYHINYFSTNLQEDIIKNSILIYSIELLNKILKEGDSNEELYDFAYNCLIYIDSNANHKLSNIPLFFTYQCGYYLGYSFTNNYTVQKVYADLVNGCFSDSPNTSPYTLTKEECNILSKILSIENIEDLSTINVNSTVRFNILLWYIKFLQYHCGHLSNMKSLDVLRVLLH